VQEHHGDGRDLLTAHPRGNALHAALIERDEHVAVFVHPLAGLEAPSPGHERDGTLEKQIVDVVANLGAHLEDVAESLGREQGGLRAFSLDEGIGDERGRVNRDLEVFASDTRLRQQRLQPLDDALRGVAGGRQALVQVRAPGDGINEDEIRERAPNVKSQTKTPCLGHLVGAPDDGSRMSENNSGRAARLWRDQERRRGFSRPSYFSGLAAG
jgi:hypothetical protein